MQEEIKIGGGGGKEKERMESGMGDGFEKNARPSHRGRASPSAKEDTRPPTEQSVDKLLRTKYKDATAELSVFSRSGLNSMDDTLRCCAHLRGTFWVVI